MSYVIVTWEWGEPLAITANEKANQFELIPLDSDSSLSKVFSHPYRAGAQEVLSWINKNQPSLSVKNLSIQEQARFCK